MKQTEESKAKYFVHFGEGTHLVSNDIDKKFISYIGWLNSEEVQILVSFPFNQMNFRKIWNKKEINKMLKPLFLFKLNWCLGRFKQ